MHGLSITCGVPVSDNNTAPDLLPVLSRGRHRNASKGACFMELASFLAGERWSDHPSCTHPLLAELARSVNDYTTDAARPKLATLIPSVIGLTSNDPKIDVALALRAATVGLPIVSAERQGVLAVGLLACERVMCDFDDPELMPLREQGLEALDRVPAGGQVGPPVQPRHRRLPARLPSPGRAADRQLLGAGHRQGVHHRPGHDAAWPARDRDRGRPAADRRARPRSPSSPTRWPGRSSLTRA